MKVGYLIKIQPLHFVHEAATVSESIELFHISLGIFSQTYYFCLSSVSIFLYFNKGKRPKQVMVISEIMAKT